MTQSSPHSLLRITALLLFLLAMLIFSAGPHGYFEQIYAAASVVPRGVWYAISTFGDERALFALALPFSLRYRRILGPLILAAIIGWLVSYGLKHLVQQPRPGLFFPVEGVIYSSERSGHNSFPSSHVVMVFAYVGVWLTVLSARWVLPLLMLAGLVGLSRVAIGAHWPADVVGGALVGCVSAWLGVWISRLCKNAEPRHGHALLIGGMLVSAMSLPFVGHGAPGTLPLRAVLALVALGSVVILYVRPFVRKHVLTGTK